MTTNAAARRRSPAATGSRCTSTASLGVRLAAALLLLAVPLVVTTASAQTADGYYPVADGLTWTYSSGETQTLSGPRDMDGRSVMVLTHYLQGVPVSEDYLVYEGGGVLSLGTAAGGVVTPYAPALTVYAASPLQPGASWRSTTQLTGFSITLSAEVLGLRGVSTPVGRFNALQIRQQTLTSNGGQTTLDLFFVPSVGVVRFVTQDGTVIDLIDKNF